jgi:hypothetical protein
VRLPMPRDGRFHVSDPLALAPSTSPRHVPAYPRTNEAYDFDVNYIM